MKKQETHFLTYIIEGEKGSLKAIYDAIRENMDKDAAETIDIIRCLGGNTDCLWDGTIEDAAVDLKEGYIYIESREYAEPILFAKKLKELFPDLKIYWQLWCPGKMLYQTNDREWKNTEQNVLAYDGCGDCQSFERCEDAEQYIGEDTNSYQIIPCEIVHDTLCD